MEAKVKGCFIKTPYGMNLPWRSLEYEGPERLLKAYRWKSRDFGLMVELETDIWVIGVPAMRGTQAARYSKEIKRAIKSNHTNLVEWHEVPWGIYDVVISVDPIVSSGITKMYPKVLWCFHAQDHTTNVAKRARMRISGFEHYDLYLDHFKHPENKKGVYFPYTSSYDQFHSLFSPTNEPAVFLASRLVQDYKKSPERYERCGLPIAHSGHRIRFGSGKGLIDVAEGKCIKTWDYLERLSKCRYYLIDRPVAEVGQAVVEAASMGCIVVASRGLRYGDTICPDVCLFRHGDIDTAMSKIIKLEQDEELREKVLEHQRKRLKTDFWDYQMDILETAVQKKRKNHV